MVSCNQHVLKGVCSCVLYQLCSEYCYFLWYILHLITIYCKLNECESKLSL
jgi:hypothetical protein